MASKEVEVLDPAPTVEKLEKSASERVLNRRHFIAALGVAGAAAVGTELVKSGPTALAQQPKPSGYAQADVLNFLLNVKYLKATLYSYITQGVDLPPAAFANLGSGGIFNPPKQITFTAAGSASASQITDLFNEMFYDELNDLVVLRGILGVAASARATMNMLGTGVSTATGTQTVTQVQAISLLRMLEDLSASAFAGATIYLTGTNLQYATQALATNGFHAGALRLLAIQAGAPYYSPQDLTTSTTGTQTQNTFTASTVSGSTTIYNFAPTNPITVGSIITGPNVLPNTVVTAVSPTPVYTGSLSGSTATPNNIISNVTPLTGLVPGMVLAGTGIPANSIITNISGATVTVGTITGYTSLVPSTPPFTGGTPITNGLLGITGLNPQPQGAASGMTPGTYTLVIDPPPAGGTQAKGTITVTTAGTLTTPGLFTIVLTASGSGYVAPPNISAPTGGTPPVLIATMPAQITTTSASVTMTPGFIAATNKNTTLSYVSQTAPLTPGQMLTGTGIPANGFIAQGGINAAADTVTISSAASVTSSAAPTGTVTLGSPIITGVSSFSGVLFGLPITGTGIPAGATVSTFDPVASTITMSTAATVTTTGTSSVAPTAFLTKNSNIITSLSSLTGLAPGNKVTGVGVPAGTIIGSVGQVNTATMVQAANPALPSNATATTTLTAVTPTVTAILQSGNNIVSYITPIPYATTFPSTIKTGQYITDAQGNIPPGTTITAFATASNTITLSAPATGATTVTNLYSFTGTVVVSYGTISSIPAAAFTDHPTGSSTPYLSTGVPISGPNIPYGTSITGVFPATNTITISQFPTAAGGPEIIGASLSILSATVLTASTLQTIQVVAPVSTETVTMPALITVTASLATATLSQAATATGTNTVIIEGTDNMDVEPYDPGTAALASAGPAPIAGTSPAVYGGFFDTASGATSSANNPVGSTFARTFSQVLAVLYASTTAQTFQGGFFPNGVAGGINFV